MSLGIDSVPSSVRAAATAASVDSARRASARADVGRAAERRSRRPGTAAALDWQVTHASDRFFPHDLEAAVLFYALATRHAEDADSWHAMHAVDRWRSLRGGRADDVRVLREVSPAMLAQALGLDAAAYESDLRAAVELASHLADHGVFTADDVVSDWERLPEVDVDGVTSRPGVSHLLRLTRTAR